MNAMMRTMPYPQKAVHHILVRKPSHAFHEQESADGDDRTDNYRNPVHCLFSLRNSACILLAISVVKINRKGRKDAQRAIAF
jgi:hypothetical protein